MLQQAFAFERTILTPYTFITILLPPLFGFYAMAVLVQLPRTNFYRTALLPVVWWSSFRASVSLDLSRNNPYHAYHDQTLAMNMFMIAARSTVWMLSRHPYSRIPICGATNEDTDRSDVSISAAMWNAWNLGFNFRGIGWNKPQNTYIPTPYLRVESRPIFALLCFCRFTFLVLVFDILCVIALRFGYGIVGAVEGTTIFDTSLPAPERYLKSSVITLHAGISIYILLDAPYQLSAVLFTMLFRQHPSEWPPTLDFPWLSTSLRSLWAKRWHQYLREILVEIAGKPLQKYFGKAGLVMGAFALSGLIHDVGVRAVGQGAYTLQVAGFFVMQGVGVLMEAAWEKVTGKRVGGFIGWLWVCFWLVLWGNSFVDVWARLGMFKLSPGSAAYRPTTLFLNWMAETNASR